MTVPSSPTDPADDRKCYSYVAYGMNIHSNHEFSELAPFDSPVADLIFRRTVLPRPLPEIGQQVFEFGENEAYIAFGAIGHCLIRGNDLVEFEVREGVDPVAMNLVLLGSVMATILYFRGFLTLHASAVDIGGRGAIFMGNKGAGKSTTAAAFIRAGYRLVTDDVLPIDVSGDGAPRMIPGYPHLKLTKSASNAIVLADVTSVPLGSLGAHKNRLRLEKNFSPATIAPCMFYVLSHRDLLEARRLSGSEALAALMANSYHARHGDQLFRGHVAAAQMRKCAKLLRCAQVKILEIPAGLDRLSKVVEFVERDIASPAG